MERWRGITVGISGCRDCRLIRRFLFRLNTGYRFVFWFLCFHFSGFFLVQTQIYSFLEYWDLWSWYHISFHKKLHCHWKTSAYIPHLFPLYKRLLTIPKTLSKSIPTSHLNKQPFTYLIKSLIFALINMHTNDLLRQIFLLLHQHISSTLQPQPANRCLPVAYFPYLLIVDQEVIILLNGDSELG